MEARGTTNPLRRMTVRELQTLALAQGQARCAHAARANARRDPTSALGGGEGFLRLIATFVNSGGAQFREYFVLAQPDMIRDYAQVTSAKFSERIKCALHINCARFALTCFGYGPGILMQCSEKDQMPVHFVRASTFHLQTHYIWQL